MTGSRRSRKLRWAIFILVALTGLGGYFYKTRLDLPQRFAVVEPGVLYRSAQPDRYEFANILRRHPIKTVLCLRHAESARNPKDPLRDEQATCDRLGVRFFHWPSSSETPMPESRLVDFLRLTRDGARTPILVHCAAGRERTSFLCAVYRIVIDRWSLDQVLKEMESFGFDLATHPRLVDALRKLDPDELRRKVEAVTSAPVTQRTGT